MSIPPADYLPEERLAVYGSLRPGERNAHVLASLAGEWTKGVVHGALRQTWAQTYARCRRLGSALAREPQEAGRVPRISCCAGSRIGRSDVAAHPHVFLMA